MDVQSYLSRLDIESPGEPDLDLLKRVHERHLMEIPFENLDIHRGVPIELDEEQILRKIVTNGRGGFCYELNTAFAWLLRHLGFEVRVLSAEVAKPDGTWGIPFDHMTLRVELDRPFLADVGFGDSFRHPLVLYAGAEVEQLGHVYRLRRQPRQPRQSQQPQREDWWFLDRQPEGAAIFQPQYRFTLAPRKLEDFTDGCHYHQTSPDSHFTQNTICSKAIEDGRVTLLPDRLVTTRGSTKQETPIRELTEWEEALQTHFGMSA
jgi:N-hydroxyarylamine O-acetyltransferase